MKYLAKLCAGILRGFFFLHCFDGYHNCDAIVIFSGGYMACHCLYLYGGRWIYFRTDYWASPVLPVCFSHPSPSPRVCFFLHPARLASPAELVHLAPLQVSSSVLITSHFPSFLRFSRPHFVNNLLIILWTGFFPPSLWADTAGFCKQNALLSRPPSLACSLTLKASLHKAPRKAEKINVYLSYRTKVKNRKRLEAQGHFGKKARHKDILCTFLSFPSKSPREFDEYFRPSVKLMTTNVFFLWPTRANYVSLLVK